MSENSLPLETRTEQQARWAAELQYCDIPQDVVERTKELFLDWLGCTLAGRNHPAISAITRFAAQMGPSTGNCELIDGSQAFTTSPVFASLINGASSHVVEQDDLHNKSIMHPVSHAMELAFYTDVNLILGDCYFSSGPIRISRYPCQWAGINHRLRSWLRSWLPRGRISGEEPLRGIALFDKRKIALLWNH